MSNRDPKEIERRLELMASSSIVGADVRWALDEIAKLRRAGDAPRACPKCGAVLDGHMPDCPVGDAPSAYDVRAGKSDYWYRRAVAAESALASARKEIERLKPDAERWQWARDDPETFAELIEDWMRTADVNPTTGAWNDTRGINESVDLARIATTENK